MSVASFLLSNFSKKSPLSEAFDIKVLGFDKSSKNFYVNVGGVTYNYSPKNDNVDMVSVLKNFYRKTGNPVKALAELKSYTTSKRIDKVPGGLTAISSVNDIDKLNAPSAKPQRDPNDLGNDEEDKLYQDSKSKDTENVENMESKNDSEK